MNERLSSGPFQFGRVAEELIGDLRGVPSAVPAGQRKRPTQTVGGLVEALMEKHKIGRECPEDEVRSNWCFAVGAPQATHSHAVTIDSRGRLVVIASHAVVRQELSIQRRQIVERIKGLPGCAHIRELVIRAC